MATILIIQGHPDPGGGHLCHALADAYAAGAQAAGHTVLRVDVGRLDIPLLRTQHDFRHAPPLHALAATRAALVEAEHVALFFPLWLGGMPAVLKGFLEQLLRPGFAFDYVEGGGTRMLLEGRSARVVVTMGMPALIFRLWYLGAGISALTRNILGFVGFSPVRATVLGGVEAAGEARRRRWLDRMEALGHAGR
ncbi:NAD(P)H-dependent oxidoreductase [Xanthobacter oligotrophicus]|uniref:NAD(P)H-dependent oxidoreductase n=1 Tax=Xanthobacter oligotrophicus TaxID=2607286 RepID=UPI0011F3F847|nr:NAD(P)H-dependent oxidoreductase [Xanthobacter oligotrophicus]MCG5233703.1 NAD(P)H-dependent oxidoreductase [Xanthobacter oligotrophicus]